MNEYSLLLLILLPLSALSGWYFAIRSVRCGDTPVDIDNDKKRYFRGLNYLLQDQPDKAIDIFIDMVNLDKDTVETHLALGSLFRKRGEVERAIRIHQNIIARPNLDREQHESAIYELAVDYFKAGLLDRAESLLQELSDSKYFQVQALKRLQLVYQNERNWEEAVEVTQKLITLNDEESPALLNNFVCEIIDNHLRSGRVVSARKVVKKNRVLLEKSPRARMLMGRIEYKAENHKAAYHLFIETVELDMDYLPLVIIYLQKSAQNINCQERLELFLKEISTEYRGIIPSLYLVDYIEKNNGRRSAAEFLLQQLEKNPSSRGLQKLLEYFDALEQDHKGIIKIIIDSIVDRKLLFKCNSCGFEAKNMYWRCPGCQSWDSIKPIK